MELLLSRRQKIGLISSTITFVLDVKTRLTDEETELVRKYRLGKEVVYERHPLGDSLGAMSDLRATFTVLAAKALKLVFTVDNLVKGRSVEAKDIVEAIGAEEEIKRAAENFYDLLMSCKHFEGEEVITYPRPQ